MKTKDENEADLQARQAEHKAKLDAKVKASPLKQLTTEDMKDIEKAKEPLNVDHVIKIIIIGDSNVGKTSILKKFIHNRFEFQFDPTIGVDFEQEIMSAVYNNSKPLEKMYTPTRTRPGELE